MRPGRTDGRDIPADDHLVDLAFVPRENEP
jgi:hypothetical protein